MNTPNRVFELVYNECPLTVVAKILPLVSKQIETQGAIWTLPPAHGVELVSVDLDGWDIFPMLHPGVCTCLIEQIENTLYTEEEDKTPPWEKLESIEPDGE